MDPGLYAVGAPQPESPVVVTSNYKLTFDVVRRDLTGLDAWLLVLDTRGINVWCAAGKHRFSTDELVSRIHSSGLAGVVTHRTVIVPQLGATGVAAHEVKPRARFKAVIGPVRSADIPAFLEAGMKATAPMREVTFGMWDRVVLAPVEFVGMLRLGLWAIPLLAAYSMIGPWVLEPATPGMGVIEGNGQALAKVAVALASALATRGLAAVLAYLVAALAGTVLTPILLPWIPVRQFWLKGTIVGAVCAVPFGAALVATGLTTMLGAAALALIIAAISAWGAMNYTGTSTFTSPSGVEEEMRRGIPTQAVLLGLGAVMWLASAWIG